MSSVLNKPAMVTMRDVAARAGVSQPLVSYVLAGKKKGVSIRDETRARVWAAADELGYRPNELARAMMRGQSKVIGFLTRNPEAEHVARLIAGALDEADAQGYFVKVLRARGDESDERLIKQCVELRLAGVIAALLDEETTTRFRDELGRYNIPLALLDDHTVLAQGTQVLTNYEQAMGLAVAHLHELGHRDIVFLTGRSNSGSTLPKTSRSDSQAAPPNGREAGFEHAMRMHGLAFSPDSVIVAEWDVAAMMSAVKSALQSSPRPTALIAATDATALPVLRAARQLGLEVPTDFSVVGFGDLHMAELCDPPLTTIYQPFHEMGCAVVQSLLSAEEDATENVRVEAHLVVRESTAPPR